MKNSIIIKTRLHSSLSDAGVHVERTYAMGPRNLMLAIEDRKTISRENEQGYGNAGHCGTWIEVAGVEMLEMDLRDYEHNTDPTEAGAASKTDWCRRFVADATSGAIQSVRKQMAESEQRNRKLYESGLSDGRGGKPKSSDEYEYCRGYHDGKLDAAELEAQQ